MITKLEDFLRRRSKISLVSRQETIQKSDGLLEACEILFGDDAKMRFNEYFREHPVVNGIARDPSSGQAAVDDAETAEANNDAQMNKQKEGEFETLNW